MPDKQLIAFPLTLTKQDWAEELRGWRCPALKIPGAKVGDLLIAGNPANFSAYTVAHDLGVVRWAGSERPEQVTVIIKLTEELSTKELTLWWRKFATFVPILAALVVGTLSYVTARTRCPPVVSNAEAVSLACDKSVRITVPLDGQHVPQQEEVKGTYQDLPPGHRIWSMVYVPSIGKFYPQGEAELFGSAWSSRVILGLNNEAGMEFQIYAVAADEKAHTQLSIYAQRAREKNENSGLRNLPEGARRCHYVTVTRK